MPRAAASSIRITSEKFRTNASRPRPCGLDSGHSLHESERYHDNARALRALSVAFGSHTHASLANHSCSVRQIGQYERAKNTGVELKRSGSASYPVGMSRPVSGHRIMTVPIGASSWERRLPFFATRLL